MQGTLGRASAAFLGNTTSIYPAEHLKKEAWPLENMEEFTDVLNI